MAIKPGRPPTVDVTQHKEIFEMKPRHTIALALLVAPMLALAGTEDEDARFDDAVRDFGFTSGAALQCAEAAQKPRIESQALKAYSGIVRLFGSDQAFFYAAAFGAGSVMPVDKAKCPEFIASFEKSMNRSIAK
jgi:hypothetical protein